MEKADRLKNNVKRKEIRDKETSTKNSGRLEKKGGESNITKRNTESACDRNSKSSSCNSSSSSKTSKRRGDSNGHDIGGGSGDKRHQSSFKRRMKLCIIAAVLISSGFLLGFTSALLWGKNKVIDQEFYEQAEHLYQHKQHHRQHPQPPGSDCPQQKYGSYANNGYQQQEVLSHQNQQQLSQSQKQNLHEKDSASLNFADNQNVSPVKENSNIKNVKDSQDKNFEIPKTNSNHPQKNLPSKRTVEEKPSENRPQENKVKSELNKNTKTEILPKKEDKTKSSSLPKDSTSPLQNQLSDEPMKLDVTSGSNIVFNMSTNVNEPEKSTTREDQRRSGTTSESKKNKKQTKAETKKKTKKTESEKSKTSVDEDLPPEVKNFKSTIQEGILPKKIFSGGRRIPPIHLLPQKPNNSSVNVYMFEEFLSDAECDGLKRAHEKYVDMWSKKDPILCFDGIQKLREQLIHVGKGHINVSPLDFTEGTMCVNKTFSTKLKSWMKSRWNYNTAFYPGESRFSKALEKRIEQAMGLRPENGGKFQITSYPNGIGCYKHTDCQERNEDQRDKVATVLIYLETVTEGGETRFPEIGIWVRPRKGRALLWNNMNKNGQCESLSQHLADPVKTGNKYILQRWYYYESFYSLGKRPPKPHLPIRDEYQPRVTCDESESGSCRWYDDWNYDHLLEYRSIGKRLRI
ncbi:uncharacterized protein LOC115215919 [Octopus sinensis]|uniref:Uncharacterized protein LOC115215919 n=1 Tax=Octopus sinensis TaxID=2607531 RepID=A0A6P7SSK5_9MOLL|nr:uncharacterized protein LOC115215919 [Octopus sinensis]